jgi:DNA-binding response OmpR family regulator
MIRTILLVDDDPGFVELVRRKLEANGYAVVMAFDGREGLLKAQTASPDLVLLDLAMPGMDGFETLRALKAAPKTAAIPVVMLTSQGDRKHIFAAEQLGASDFLVKPVPWDTLLDVIRTNLPGSPS